MMQITQIYLCSQSMTLTALYGYCRANGAAELRVVCTANPYYCKMNGQWHIHLPSQSKKEM